jgi:S1-C subfamily serine protease
MPPRSRSSSGADPVTATRVANLADTQRVNLLDVAALILIAFAILAGFASGALPQLGGICGALAGLFLALAAAPWLVDVTQTLEPIPRALVVLGAIIGAVAVGEAIGSAVGRSAVARLGRGVLSTMERVVGGVIGAAQALLIIWLAGGLLAAGPFPTLGRVASNSVAVRTLDSFLPPATEVVGEIAADLDTSGLPDVFVGLEPIPLDPVAVPTDARTAAIAKAATRSTAMISSRACSSLITGTGAIIAPGYLVTNAHVIAGATTIRAKIGSTIVDATPVLFDPDFDIAVLHVAHLDGPTLRFANVDPVRGRLGAALGYAGGGPLVLLPAAVAGDYPATGRDIYGRGRITRDILELRAGVEPGDSGGPFILEDGTIGGIVFAESRTDPLVGYALTPTSVAVRIAPALGRTSQVGVGDCLR